jgi:hypothetical protein
MQTGGRHRRAPPTRNAPVDPGAEAADTRPRSIDDRHVVPAGSVGAQLVETKEGTRMQEHRFRVGQTVRFAKASRSGGLGGSPGGSFRVVSLMPDYQGNYQYRVQSTSDGHQRVVVEAEIVLQ